MKKTICVAILVAFCLTMVVPVSATVYPENVRIYSYTFDNGITIRFPFNMASSYVVAFVGNGNEDISLVYLYETVPAVLNYDNGVALMGYNLAQDGKSCQADLYAMGSYYESVLIVKNGVAEVIWPEAFRTLHEGEPGVLRKVTQGSGYVCCGCSRIQLMGGEAYGFGDTYNGITLPYAELAVPWPKQNNWQVAITSPEGPFYAANEYQFSATVGETESGTPESTVYWYVHGNTSPNTTIDNEGLLYIASDETSDLLEVEAVSTAQTNFKSSVEVPISYPLLGSMVAPSGTQTFVESSKRQEVQFELLLPNGEPYNYTDIEWTIQPSSGASSYFRIDDNGLLVVEPNAPAGSSCTVHFAYGFDTDNVSSAGATVKIVSTQEGIYDNLTPTPEQSGKAEDMEDAIGDAADKLENNNSSLGQLTPSRPQINTNLEFDQDQMLAVSPLVTNIWSINGVGRMISIVLVVATVAYIFFGKRDG